MTLIILLLVLQTKVALSLHKHASPLDHIFNRTDGACLSNVLLSSRLPLVPGRPFTLFQSVSSEKRSSLIVYFPRTLCEITVLSFKFLCMQIMTGIRRANMILASYFAASFSTAFSD